MTTSVPRVARRANQNVAMTALATHDGTDRPSVRGRCERVNLAMGDAHANPDSLDMLMRVHELIRFM